MRKEVGGISSKYDRFKYLLLYDRITKILYTLLYYTPWNKGFLRVA